MFSGSFSVATAPGFKNGPEHLAPHARHVADDVIRGDIFELLSGENPESAAPDQELWDMARGIRQSMMQLPDGRHRQAISRGTTVLCPLSGRDRITCRSPSRLASIGARPPPPQARRSMRIGSYCGWEQTRWVQETPSAILVRRQIQGHRKPRRIVFRVDLDTSQRRALSLSRALRGAREFCRAELLPE